VTRQIEFHKWGRHWSLMVYLRPPVSQENLQRVERILESFHFDGVPAGDPIWAIGEARKHLPPEAEPDQFSREGGSSVYYVSTSREGNDVLVTFTKRRPGQPKQTWSFRVSESGQVRFQPGDGSAAVKAAVSNLVSRISGLALVSVGEYQNSVTAFLTVGRIIPKDRRIGESWETRPDLMVRVDSFASERDARQGLEESVATRPMHYTAKETLDGLTVYRWSPGWSMTLVCRVGRRVVDVSSIQRSAAPVVTNVLAALANELQLEPAGEFHSTSAEDAVKSALNFVRSKHLDTSPYELAAPEAVQRISIAGEMAWRVSWRHKTPTGAPAIAGGQLIVIIRDSGRIEKGAGE
jgi:hypothetical protein